jgi:hypothetical protein
MITVEKTENTLQISKLHKQTSKSNYSEVSKGLSSGHLEVFKTESELYLRPGSPERYKSIINPEDITPYIKLFSQREKSNASSFKDLSHFRNLNETSIEDLSLILDFTLEDFPDSGNSFFSSANEAKKMQIFSIDREIKEKNCTFDSFASTNSKPGLMRQDLRNFRTGCREYKNWYPNECDKCKSSSITNIQITYPETSM